MERALVWIVILALVLGYGAWHLLPLQPAPFESLSWRHAPLLLLGGLIALAAQATSDSIGSGDRQDDPLKMRALRLAGMFLVAGIGAALLYLVATRL